MKPPAFQFYASDFMMGTAMMTAEEVGAYIRLLCFQWDRGSIPDDDGQLSRLGGCSIACLPALRQKFERGADGLLRNARMERERVKQAEYRAAQSGNGKAGANKRWHGGANGVAIATPLANTMAKHSSPSPSPSPSPITTETTEDPNPSASPTKVDAVAESIYQEYPRKQGKAAALKAIRAALRVKTAPQLQEAVESYAAAVALWPAPDVQFVPHPATWFNRGSYDDDPTTWQRVGTNGHVTQDRFKI